MNLFIPKLMLNLFFIRRLGLGCYLTNCLTIATFGHTIAFDAQHFWKTFTLVEQACLIQKIMMLACCWCAVCVR